MTRILGIDPGLASTGWGVVELDGNQYRHVDHGVIKSTPDLSIGERLMKLNREIRSIISKYRPDQSGVESLYFARNATSAIPVAQARGVVLLALTELGVPLHEYPPQAIKQALVGNGRAEKHQVQEMVKMLLGMKSVPKPDHASDALAAAICHISYANSVENPSRSVEHRTLNETGAAATLQGESDVPQH